MENIELSGSVLDLNEDIDIDEELDTLLEDDFYAEVDEEIDTLLSEAEDDEEEEVSEEETEESKKKQPKAQPEPTPEETSNPQDANASGEATPNPDPNTNPEDPMDEDGLEGGDMDEEDDEPTEEELKEAEAELNEDKDRYSYFRLFNDMLNNSKFFIDKLKDIIEDSRSDADSKAILRVVLEEVYSLKEDLEFLLISKIKSLSLDNIKILYMTISSKTKVLLELVEKILKTESNND